MEIARAHNLRMVEDSCETMFARDHGKAVGSFGDIGCFSTYVAHVINTGVGGLCTTSDPDLIVTLKSLMAQIALVDQDDLLDGLERQDQLQRIVEEAQGAEPFVPFGGAIVLGIDRQRDASDLSGDEQCPRTS